MATRRVSLIPKAPCGRILVNAGAKRVAAEAIDAFSDIIADIALQIGEKASQIAKHSGRKTVQEGDIKIAARQ